MTHKLGMAHSIACAGPQDWCCWQMAPGEGCRGGGKEIKQEDGMRKAGGAPGRRLMQSCATNALQLSCCKGTMAGRSLLRWTTARQRAGVARMCERCKHLQLAHWAAGDTHNSALHSRRRTAGARACRCAGHAQRQGAAAVRKSAATHAAAARSFTCTHLVANAQATSGKPQAAHGALGSASALCMCGQRNQALERSEGNSICNSPGRQLQCAEVGCFPLRCCLSAPRVTIMEMWEASVRLGGS